jgi:hypothetical protein
VDSASWPVVCEANALELTPSAAVPAAAATPVVPSTAAAHTPTVRAVVRERRRERSAMRFVVLFDMGGLPLRFGEIADRLRSSVNASP